MKVVNIRKDKCDIYVGRKSQGMHYGNPFSHQSGTLAIVVVASVAEAISAYEDWLDGLAYQEIEPERRLWILEHLSELKNQTLGCFCAPKPCHADVLLRKANLEDKI